jgi:Asp-tRNA(Asn)/Glu-tRNA(Gln) amidotransferase A subunit family amidase
VPTAGCFPLAPSYDHVGPMASTVAGCVELLHALAPEFQEASIGSLDDLRIAVAWLEHADPLVAERVAAMRPNAEPLDFPLPDRAEYALFDREVAAVHSALFAERADEYGENVRVKIEQCLEVSDAEVARAEELRRLYREQCDELIDGFDLLLTPTIAFVAPPVDVDERAQRRRGTLLTYPFDTLGWPALALPCGPAEHGLPASVQLVAPRGEDARVLAAGELLASLV